MFDRYDPLDDARDRDDHEVVRFSASATVPAGASNGIKSYLDGLIEKRQQVDGVTGSFLLGSDHDARRLLYISEVRDGAFQVLKTLPTE